MNKKILTPYVAFCFLCFLFSHSVFALEQKKTFQVKAAQYLGPEHAVSMEMAREERALKAEWNLDSSKSFQLNALSKEEQNKIAATDNRGRQRIGIVRDIPADQASETEMLVWKLHEDSGKIAAITASSPSASALRLGIYIEKIAPEAELRFFSYDSQGEVPPVLVTGADILKLIQMNLKAEPDNPNARLYWSPSINGDKAGVEIYLPVGHNPEETEIQLKKLSHKFDSSSVALESSSALADTVDTPCYNDVVCYPDLFQSKSAVTKIIYINDDDQGEYVCTGTLLNDSDENTWIPYFITANHCIGSQSEASSMVVYWNYESKTCDSSTPASWTPGFGAEWLWGKGLTQEVTNENMDVSFLKLDKQPPAGTWFGGWLVTDDVVEEATRIVHHPGGDLKKISFGSSIYKTHVCYKTWKKDETGELKLQSECSALDGGPFSVSNWLSGGTEGGSSGAGIFNINEQLTGIHSIGSNEISCDSGGEISTRSYATNFKDAYDAGELNQWLGDGSTTPQSTSVGNIVPITALLLLGKGDNSSVVAVPLNDTGITWSGNYASGNNTECIASMTPDGDNVVAAQDCSHGRDATHNDDSDGHAGFSYTKLDSNGVPLANQNADYATTPWACVRDNVTGLIWEVKTYSGLHSKYDAYTWYNTNPNTNGGADGSADHGGDICYGYDSSNPSTFCNTEAYVNRVNAAGWCGASNWRMSTRKELESIVVYGGDSPAIDTEYFPNMSSSFVWSGSPLAGGSNSAWYLYFGSGGSGTSYCYNYQKLRLVREGQ